MGKKRLRKVRYCDVRVVTHSHKLVSVVISCYQWPKVVENIRCTTNISDVFVDYSRYAGFTKAVEEVLSCDNVLTDADIRIGCIAARSRCSRGVDTAG